MRWGIRRDDYDDEPHPWGDAGNEWGHAGKPGWVGQGLDSSNPPSRIRWTRTQDDSPNPIQDPVGVDSSSPLLRTRWARTQDGGLNEPKARWEWTRQTHCRGLGGPEPKTEDSTNMMVIMMRMITMMPMLVMMMMMTTMMRTARHTHNDSMPLIESWKSIPAR